MNIGEIKKIGIALAAFNPDPKYFSEQLQSIQDQSFSSWVCVVTFDSPMKNILELPSLSRFTKDPRFRFLENPSRLGHKKNFEGALRQLLSYELDAVAFSDQDDVWYPDKLKVCAELLENQPQFSLVHSDMHVFNEEKKLQETAWELERRGVFNVKTHHLIVRNVVAGCALLMDFRLAKDYPHIPEGVEYHDHWYALVASRFGKVVPINLPLYAYRQHGMNVVAVSPYLGRFALPSKMSMRGMLEKMKKAFLKSRHLGLSLSEEGINLPPVCKILYMNSFDFGLGLGLLGLRHFFSDPQLTRSCWARAFGKIQSLVS